MSAPERQNLAGRVRSAEDDPQSDSDESDEQEGPERLFPSRDDKEGDQDDRPNLAQHRQCQRRSAQPFVSPMDQCERQRREHDPDEIGPEIDDQQDRHREEEIDGRPPPTPSIRDGCGAGEVDDQHERNDPPIGGRDVGARCDLDDEDVGRRELDIEISVRRPGP
jgi:hypothetical protein